MSGEPCDTICWVLVYATGFMHIYLGVLLAMLVEQICSTVGP